MKTWKLNDRASCWDLIELTRKIHPRVEDFSEGDLIKRIKRFEVYVLQKVSLSQIHRDAYSIDEDEVKGYAERNVQTMPPIILGEKFGVQFADDPTEKYDIVDGNHRLESQFIRDNDTIMAFIPIEDTRIDESDEDDDEED